MNRSIPFFFVLLFLAGCNTTTKPAVSPAPAERTPDTLTYLFKATYSSDITVPSNPGYAQKVLQVWKMFETANIETMKPYFADTVTYDDASGMHFYGPAAKLLAYAKKDIEGLDSMRFDISMWQSAHVNDKNEDWINIWSSERRYPKKGIPDTVLMQENWRVKEGRVVYFNQYLAKLPK
ncbi:MAG TPA: hypothetical protein VGM30_16730 [Puia sp.]|jgi:hypothetical protein